MKSTKIFITASIIFSAGALHAQTDITLSEVKNHINDSVSVCGKIFGAKYRYIAKKFPDQLSMGGRFPNPPLTLVFTEDVKRKFSYDPEKRLIDHQICIKGKIQLYDNHPAILVQSQDDIKVTD